MPLMRASLAQTLSFCFQVIGAFGFTLSTMAIAATDPSGF
jgi:hypothetical protein